MQLKIRYQLTLLLGIVLVGDLASIGYLFLNRNNANVNTMLLAGGLLAFNFIFFYVYKFLEERYDKHMITKMATKGQIALANIKSAKAVKTIRDSNMKYFNIWEVSVDFYDEEYQKHEIGFYEKMNINVKNIPNGTVYITYDKAKPNRNFIIQNAMIAGIPSLQPIVEGYENCKDIPIKYLNAYYNDGMIVETFKESLNKNK